MRAAMTPNSRTDLVERKTVTVIEPLKQKKNHFILNFDPNTSMFGIICSLNHQLLG
jgi:hypothetical protein